MRQIQISDLYAFFDGCFPGSFTKQFDDPEGKKLDNWRAVWSMALEKYSDQEIEKAKRKMVERGFPFPPSLPEFVALVEASVKRVAL
jgi:hypothetical protein